MYLYPLFTSLRVAAADSPAQAVLDSASAKKAKGVEEEKKVAGGEEAKVEGESGDEGSGMELISSLPGRRTSGPVPSEEKESSAAAEEWPVVTAHFLKLMERVKVQLRDVEEGLKCEVILKATVHVCDGHGRDMPEGHTCILTSAAAEQRQAEKKLEDETREKLIDRRREEMTTKAALDRKLLGYYHMHGSKALEYVEAVHEGAVRGLAKARAHLNSLLRLEARNEETTRFLEKARLRATCSRERARVDLQSVGDRTIFSGEGEQIRKDHRATELAMCVVAASRAKEEAAEMILVRSKQEEAEDALTAIIEEIHVSVKFLKTELGKAASMAAHAKTFFSKCRSEGVL
jgi:hypothetical protein